VGFQQLVDGAGIEGVVGQARDHLSKAIDLLKRESGPDRDSTIHGVRKRVKKVRALIRLARGAVPRKAIEKADRQLREAARPLSAVRDAFVLIQTLDSLSDGVSDPVLIERFALARASLEAHRDQVACKQLEESGGLASTSKALRSTRRRLVKWVIDGDHPGLLGAYKRAYRRGREALGVVAADPSGEELHELRKRVKGLGYQLRTLEGDEAGPVARLRRLAELLADELGEVHDLDILHEFLAQSDESCPILEPLDRRRLDLRRSALQRAGVVFLDKPRAFARKLEAATAGVGTDG
jgi:CHAD domain-containing protein